MKAVDFFDPSDYQIIIEISRTTIWTFYEVENTQSHYLYNMIEVELDFKNKSTLKEYNEICFERFREIIHPNLPNLVGYSDKNLSGQNHPCYLLEYQQVQSLRDIISKNTILNNMGAKYYILFQIAHCMDYIHKKGVVHKRLCIDSIVVDHNFDIFIIDYFLPRHEIENTKDFGACIKYMSKDMLKGEKIYHNVDVFSFGLIMFAIIFNQEPYQEFKNDQQILAAISGGYVPKIPKDIEIKNRIKATMSMCINSPEGSGFEKIVFNFRNYFPLGKLVCIEQGIKYLVFDESVLNIHNDNIICQPQKICSTPIGDITVRVGEKCDVEQFINIISLYYDINERLQLEVGDHIIKSKKLDLQGIDKFYMNINHSPDEDDEDSIYIRLKSLTGISEPMKVKGTDTIFDLKMRFQDLTGAPIDLMRLVFAGNTLEDEKEVQSYNIDDGYAIHVVFRLLG